MMNIINGGVHAPNNLDIQEFMIMPLRLSLIHISSRTLDGVGLPPEAVMPPKPPMPEQPLRKNSRAIIGSVTSGRCIL